MADPTRGLNLLVDAEDPLCAPAGSPLIWECTERPVPPSAVKQLIEQANLHYHPAKADRKPLYVETAQESAFPVSIDWRLGNGAGKMPPVMQGFKSAGWNVEIPGVASATIDGTPTTTSISVDADLQVVAGDVVLVQTGTSSFEPVVVAAYDDTPFTITPGMALASAPSVGHEVYACYSAFPLWDQVSTTSTLTFYLDTRGTHTAGDDWRWQLKGSAASGLGALTFEPGQKIPPFAFTFHVTDISYTNSALAAGTAQDKEKQATFTNAVFGFAAADDTGGIARTLKPIISATWNPPLTTKIIPGEGDTSDVNSCQGYMSDPEDNGTLEVTFLQEKTLTDECYEENSDLNELKYCQLVIPTTDYDDVPALGLFMPQCYQSAPVVYDYSDHYYKMTCTFRPTAAEYGSSTVLTSHGMAPVILGMQHPYAT